MLLSVTGASGVGKSSTLPMLAQAFAGRAVTCVDFDSVGVPIDAGIEWRHSVVEHWVREAVREQEAGRHMLLCGQVPVGELLAAPSADRLDAIAVCMLHCSPEVRRARLASRGDGPARADGHVAFGEWFLGHTLDPAHMPHVIRVAMPVAMRWERWADWSADDERWSFDVIDTDALTREEVGDRVVAWADEALAGRRPMLTGDWAAG